MISVKMTGLKELQKTLEDEKRLDAVVEAVLGETAEMVAERVKQTAPRLEAAPEYKNSIKSGTIDKERSVAFVDLDRVVPFGEDRVEFIDKMAKNVLAMEFGLATEEERGNPHWRPAARAAKSGRRLNTRRLEGVLSNPRVKPPRLTKGRVSETVAKEIEEFSRKIGETV